MGLFSKKERRSTKSNENENPREDFSGELLLQHLLMSNDGVITKKEALNIPSVQGCINFISGIVSMLPIKLYAEKENKSEANEVKNDRRIKLLNDETGDTLDSVQFWRALITDYFLGKGGYAYINKRGNEMISLHYVSEEHISIVNNADPIFKDYNIIVNGNIYKPFEFLKFLRNTKDGASGSSIIKENNLILSLAYYTLIFENFLVKGGGNKKGVIKSQKKLDRDALNALKEGWRNLYRNSHENTVILNDGIDFQEISATALEMQLNENKESNSDEICKLFNISPDIFKQRNASSGGYSNAFKSTFKTGVMPVLRVIANALNKDLLLEKEKGSFYYAFDTKEMLKGDIEERFKAYETGLKSNVLTIDEARFMEDLPPLNINWVNLGLNSVLYDPKTEKFYTPNTNKLSNMEELKLNENRDTE